MKDRCEYFHIDKHGGHVSFYNLRSMQKLSMRSNFTVVNMETYGVSFFQKGDISALLYRSAKIIAEGLNTPSRCFSKGHEMLVFLKKF